MKNVGIICGGFSSEFEISVQSGTNIRNNFPDDFKTYLIFVTNDGWFVENNGNRIRINLEKFSADLEGEQLNFDFVVVYIHGDPGENGKIQAYLDIIGMPYVNSGPLASALSFDKWYCNQFLQGFGLNIAKSVHLTKHDLSHTSESIIAQLGLPVFVKPCDSGSSYGVTKVNAMEDLEPAINSAFEEGNAVVIEAFLKGTELTCGVYRTTKGIYALPLTEIVSQKDFFDYEAKYQGASDEITPARISDDLTLKVQESAKKIYDLLQLRSIARIDFMLVDNTPYVIEVNTTPGFSNESIVPKMILASGKTVKEFWKEILETELEK